MKKILIVDDDRDLLHTLNAFLSKKYVIETIDRGREALNVAPAVMPDAILLDINLGDMDGKDVCKQLKKHPATANIPVMMMSSALNEETIKKICFADEFIEKPFKIETLFLKLEKLFA